MSSLKQLFFIGLVILNACNTTTNPGQTTEENHDIPRQNSEKVVGTPLATGTQSSLQPLPGNSRRVIPSVSVKASPDTAGNSCLAASDKPLQLEKPFQQIVFRNDHDTTIRLQEGTVLRFPAHIFIFEGTNKEVKTPVTLLDGLSRGNLGGENLHSGPGKVL